MYTYNKALITDYSTFLTYSNNIKNRRSPKMADENRKDVETESFDCEQCGEKFTLSTEDLVLRNGDTRYCSEECELLAAADGYADTENPDDDDNIDDDDNDNDDDNPDDEWDDEDYNDDDDNVDDDDDNKDDDDD
jgi:hypothetical protein